MSGSSNRRTPSGGLLPRNDGWLCLSDDELLFQIQSLPADHSHDEELVRIVRSTRHFFLRQEAAKRIVDSERLKAFASDRHIGQILARHMRREADVAYLEQMVRHSRHLEVRNAALVQLRRLRKKKPGRGE